MTVLNKNQFISMFPNANFEFASILDKLLILNNIDTLERAACFIAQTGHESGGFKIFVENLNYSEEGLLKVFKKYFNADTVKPYVRNPQLIANRVYANRMGNGSEESGDGWKYRGRGLIQLTGKDNYTKFAKDRVMNLENIVRYCETMDGIVDSAIFFWNTNNCNSFADKKDFIGLTKRINGGIIGLEDRMRIYELAKKTLKSNF